LPRDISDCEQNKLLMKAKLEKEEGVKGVV
jgi:hypothetical protein